MEFEGGVFLDKSVILKRCLSRQPYTDKFFDYLQSYPSLGIVTDRIISGVKYNLNTKLNGSEREDALEVFNNSGTFLKTEKINFNDFQSSLSDVTKFFNELLNKETFIRPAYVCRRFRGLAADIQNSYSDKIFWKEPEIEDKEILAEAVCLSKKYNPLFLVSNDNHLSGKSISKAIEKTFDVKSLKPLKTLSELRKYEHLFKRKVIV